MVFEIRGVEQAKKVLNFIVENDFEFSVDERDVFSIYLKSEIENAIDNIYYDDDFENEDIENIDIDEMTNYVVNETYKSMTYGDWSNWNDWVYEETKISIEEYLGGKR